MTVDEERAVYTKQIDYLTDTIDRLEKALPTAEEMAYIRNRKRADENAAWLWQQIKTYAPWVGSIGSGVSYVVYYLATHTINIGPPK